MVARNSYIVIVNASGGARIDATRYQSIRSRRTVSLVVVFHVQEGVEVNVAVKVHVGPKPRSEHDERSHNGIRTLPASTTCTAVTADACRRTAIRTSDAAFTKLKVDTHSRVEAAHIPVGHAPAVDDVVRHHLVAARLRLVLVDPVGLVPVVVRNLAEGHLAVDDVADTSMREGQLDLS